MDRFWSKVDRGEPSECWNWLGARSSNGYGNCRVAGKTVTASRVAAELSMGRPPDGSVCHKCDNPLCCNPSHLFVSDVAGNLADMSLKLRGRGQKQRFCKNGHEYNEENTYHRKVGVLRRDCRKCSVIRSSRYADKKRRESA